MSHLYPFIHWRTLRLYPYFVYCEQCCNKCRSEDIFSISYFHFLLNIHSEVEFLDHMVASLIVFFDAHSFFFFYEVQFICFFFFFFLAVFLVSYPWNHYHQSISRDINKHRIGSTHIILCSDHQEVWESMTLQYQWAHLVYRCSFVNIIWQ